MSAFYNEIDPFAAAWLRELIAAGHIAPGIVDERDIRDICPDELAGFAQCHFFAGIGVWSLALREAGWPDDRPIWTGSCPCQPFSEAGKGEGFADERHLWPAFYWLIAQCRPELVAGEQVASKIADPWVDLVQADVEALGYAFGCLPFPAASVGAPHIRDRNFWVADASRSSGFVKCSKQWGNSPQFGEQAPCWDYTSRRSGSGGLDHPAGPRHLRSIADAEGAPRVQAWLRVSDSGRAVGGLADALRSERGEVPQGGYVGDGNDRGRDQTASRHPVDCQNGGPGPANGLWRNADWLGCTDGKWRPVEPGTFPLVDAGTLCNRVAELRGAGNAITLAQAQCFIEAVIDHLDRAPALEAAA